MITQLKRILSLKNIVLLILLSGQIGPGHAQRTAPVKDAVDYVNPLAGSPFAGFAKGLEGGGTTPIVGRPYAMTNFVVQTHENKMSRMPYIYEDSTVIGFMATHQPTVWMGDYGYVSVMPGVGEL